jgi:hypothetical protein
MAIYLSIAICKLSAIVAVYAGTQNTHMSKQRQFVQFFADTIETDRAMNRAERESIETNKRIVPGIREYMSYTKCLKAGRLHILFCGYIYSGCTKNTHAIYFSKKFFITHLIRVLCFNFS